MQALFNTKEAHQSKVRPASAPGKKNVQCHSQFPFPKFKITLRDNQKLKKKKNVPQGGWSIIYKCIFLNGNL